MSTDDTSTASSNKKSTGSLKADTGPLNAAADSSKPGPAAPQSAFVIPAPRDLSARLAEVTVFMVAVVGAVALGLGISDYLGDHPYVSVYLIAYAAFRFADLFVRDNSTLGADRVRTGNRMISYLPILLLFAAAPFERTYLYGGEGPHWLAALGVLIELVGLWLALGARIQLAFFSYDESGARVLVRSGLYRYIRHPVFLGELLTVIAWPFEYDAPITFILAVTIGIIVLRRRVRDEEAEMLAEFGDQYAAYMRETDSVIPNVW